MSVETPRTSLLSLVLGFGMGCRMPAKPTRQSLTLFELAHCMYCREVQGYGRYQWHSRGGGGQSDRRHSHTLNPAQTPSTSLFQQKPKTGRRRGTLGFTTDMPPLSWGWGEQSPPPPQGRPSPEVVKQDTSSRGSVDTTKTRSDPQRVRMSSGERPIGAAKGKQPKTEALCQPRPPLCQACLGREAATRLPLSFPQLPTAHGTKGLSTRSQGVQCSRREQGAKHPAAPLTFPCPDHHTIMKHDPFGPEENRMQMGRHAF